MTNNNNIVLDDLLSFVSHKMNTIPSRVLLNRLHSFYTEEQGQESIKKLLQNVTRPHFYVEVFEQVKWINVFEGIINVFGIVQEQDLPRFFCKDLNNIPKLGDLKTKSNLEREVFRFHQMISDLKKQKPNPNLQCLMRKLNREVTSYMQMNADSLQKLPYVKEDFMNILAIVKKLELQGSEDSPTTSHDTKSKFSISTESPEVILLLYFYTSI